MFQPTRPSLRWSSEANCRARLYGSLYVVEEVPMTPIRSVAAADAGVLGDEAIERIKGAIFQEITVSHPRGYNRDEFEQTLKQRLDAIFPQAQDTSSRSRVGTVAEMETSLDPKQETPGNG